MDFNWIEILQMGAATIGVIALSFGTKWLQHFAQKQRASADNEKLAGRELLKSQVAASLSMVASNIANKELKALKELSKDGKVDKEDLDALKDHALNTVKEEFKASGKDLMKELGPTFLDEALRFVVDRMSKDEPKAPAKKKTSTKSKRS